MKLLIVSGGGGHFAPALALISELPKDWEVLVVGRRYAFEADKTESFEYQTARKLHIPFVPLTTGRLQRKLSAQSLKSFFKVPGGFYQAGKILKDYKPDVVMSFGGYVSVPIVMSAWGMHIPIVVHEQVLSGGLANKIAAKFAEKVCISWEQSRKFFPENKIVLTGNPILHVIANEVKSKIPTGGDLEIAALLSGARNDDNKKLPVLYITGGSGGAHAINLLVEQCLEKLLQQYTVIHQTGDAKEFNDYDRLEKKKTGLANDLQKRYIVRKFLTRQEVFAVLEKADLVVSRAGMNTVSELLSVGKPSLFIPLPFGQHNEQLDNALFVKQIGLAEVVKQQDLTGDKLFEEISTMIKNITSYKQHSEKAKKLIQPDAASRIFAVIDDVNKKKKIQKS